MLPLHLVQFAMKDFLYQNRAYLIAYLIVLIAMIALLFSLPQMPLHLALNTCHSPFLDVLFKCLSVFAEWPVYLIALALILYRYSWTIYFAMAELTSAALVQIIKHVVNAPRPSVVFADNEAFRSIVVEGVKLRSAFSFPSGHTASYFIFFTVLSILLTREMTRNKALASVLSVFFVLLALCGGFSRIYLSQHFLLDVCVGSLFGVLVPCALYPLFVRIDAKPALHQGLLKRA